MCRFIMCVLLHVVWCWWLFRTACLQASLSFGFTGEINPRFGLCLFYAFYVSIAARVCLYVYFLLLLFGICFDSMSSPQHFYCPFSPELIFFSLVINEFKSGLHLFDMLMCYCIWVWFSCLPCFAFDSFFI